MPSNEKTSPKNPTQTADINGQHLAQNGTNPVRNSLVSDIALKLDKAVSEVQAEAQAEKSAWRKHLIRSDDNIQPPVVLVSYGSENLLTAANSSFVSGAAKSGKSTFVETLLAGAIGSPAETYGFNIRRLSGNVVLIDTERSRYDFLKSVRRIIARAGYDPDSQPDNFHAIHTRRMFAVQRVELLEQVCEELKPELVVVDGWADFVSSINDEKENVALAQRLMDWEDRYQTHFLGVVHTTRTTQSEQARGWLGTCLINKGECNFYIKKQDGIHTVTVKDQRNAAEINDTIGFRYEKGFGFVGLNEAERADIKQDTALPNEQALALKVFKGAEELTYRGIWPAIARERKSKKTGTPISEQAACRWIRKMVEAGYIHQSDSGNYRLSEELLAMKGDPSSEQPTDSSNQSAKLNLLN